MKEGAMNARANEQMGSFLVSSRGVARDKIQLSRRRAESRESRRLICFRNSSQIKRGFLASIIERERERACIGIVA
jgi:hypothetical protein